MLQKLLPLLLLFSCAVTKKNETITGFLPVKDAKLYYEVSGKDNSEAILFVHAGFLDTRMWDSQVAFFRKNYKVITLDMPAHGRSIKGDSTFLIQDALIGLLDHLGIQKTSVAGLSLGAVSVTDFILAYPERVNKAVLVSSGINGYETRHEIDTLTKKYFPELIGALEKKDTVQAAEVFTRWWGDGPFRSVRGWNDTVRNYIKTTTLDAMYRHKVNGWPRFSQPAAIERISSIKVPVLIIDGNMDVPYIGQASTVLQQSIPGAKRYTIKEVAHMLNMEKPDEFNLVVAAFLREK